MARVTLDNISHSYHANPSRDADYVLKNINLSWIDGGAYALLGPSGCGKSTLLNIVSGLLIPTKGQVRFDENDVTRFPPEQRNIAQVFQFPVIYDTLTVFDNLAFPLRNLGLPENSILKRVTEIATMLELESDLSRRSASLAADKKQKISMGRGLVREDVNIIMFDEPLTVIDPELKWKLRSKLKELHQEIKVTMVYVTHDQTEALTFADQVVVMQDGEVIQVGKPEDLFERPLHTFVGHFIGSPGMNILPCDVKDNIALFFGYKLQLEGPILKSTGHCEIGIRPEFIRFGTEGIPAIVQRASDIGQHTLVQTVVNNITVNVIIKGPPPDPGAEVQLCFDPAKTRLYIDRRIATERLQ
ncbi:MAG: ABC transporter ATP-binding protein [Aestuariivita sp.]|nr:ABC transporter ATP-binding protein [Aestuariivita sp.]